MFTDICFTNMSTNNHQPRVTLFQRNLFGNINQMLAWKVINNCNYQWTHPFRINWAYEYQLFDAYGNVSAINSLSANNKPDMGNGGIAIDYQLDHVIFQKTMENKVEGINLIKNKRIIAAQKIDSNNQIKFELSTTVYICADLRAQQGELIHPNDLNVSLNKLDISENKKVNLIMQGGQPGELSKPLEFLMR